MLKLQLQNNSNLTYHLLHCNMCNIDFQCEFLFLFQCLKNTLRTQAVSALQSVHKPFKWVWFSSWALCPEFLVKAYRESTWISFPLQFHVIASYPRVWNMPQSWQCEIEVYKATYHFIYAQKNFFSGEWVLQHHSHITAFIFTVAHWNVCKHTNFSSSQDLIKDWASDSAPDIYSFVPYSWTFKILLHQFEMIWAANQHNWIDCSTKQQENGKTLPLSEWEK